MRSRRTQVSEGRSIRIEYDRAPRSALKSQGYPTHIRGTYPLRHTRGCLGIRDASPGAVPREVSETVLEIGGAHDCRCLDHQHS